MGARVIRKVNGSVWRTVCGFAAWGLVHSLLATHTVKAFAAAKLGEPRRNGLYRISYNAVAVITLLALAVYIRRLPDRRLYRIHLPWRVITGLLRVGLLGVAARAALEVGVGPFSGMSAAMSYLLKGTAAYEPEAQGPSMGAAGLRTGGPFRLVRHPLNASATAMVWLTPEMTVVRLTIAVLTLAYALLGSKIEEGRLLATYGEAYRHYQESGVPFFVPALMGF